MLDNLNVEFEEMNMEELQEEFGGVWASGAALDLVYKKRK